MEEKRWGWKQYAFSGLAVLLLVMISILGVWSHAYYLRCHPIVSLAAVETLAINCGERLQIQPTVSARGISSEEVQITYHSDNEACVTVDETGMAIGQYPGESNITVRTEYGEVVVTVTVYAPLKGIAIKEEDFVLEKGKSRTLTALYQPDYTTDDRTIVWTSSAPEVVSVDEMGTVTALSAGTAVIEAACGGLTAEVQVEVDIPIASVSLDKTSLTIEKGESDKLTASYLPVDTTRDVTARWSSKDTSIADVDQNGTVTAVGTGKTTVTVEIGGIQASCEVTVKRSMISIGLDTKRISLVEGESQKIGVLYYPSDTTDNRDGEWSYNGKIMDISPDGIVTAKKAGSGVVVLEVNGFKAACEIEVLPYIYVETVSLNKTELFLNEGHTSEKLSASYTPSNAMNATVGKWESSNPKVVKVSQDGRVTALRSGTATITVTIGKKKASCKVTSEMPAPKAIVCLDPGHGGSFTGTTYGELREKDQTLKIANYCKDYLEENYVGVQVIMTRTEDIQLDPEDSDNSLVQRVMTGVNAGADVLVSLHLNAVAGGSQAANGCCTLISKQPNIHSESVRLSKCILKQLTALGIASEGWKTRDDDEKYFDENGVPLDYYSINRNSAEHGLVGIIVESCYMTEADKKFWYGEEALQKLGIANAIGIAEYLGLQQR